MTVSLIVCLACLLDHLLGEPKRYHPLVGFGKYVNVIEKALNTDSKIKGVCAVVLAIAPFLVVAHLISIVSAVNEIAYMLISAIILYIAIGAKSLMEHARHISQPLKAGDLAQARYAVSMIVSRDTQHLEETDIAKAATESVLENGADAIFAAIFWFCLLGIPGVVLYRLSNTLDAMWGYKNKRFYHFGWAAARFDDALNYVPARLTALSYALVGHTALALRCWRKQGFSWKSPNAGPVMSSGAGAINVSLGGAAQYHNEIQYRQTLGPTLEEGGQLPRAQSIDSACRLVNKTLVLCLVCITAIDYLL